MLLDDDDDDDDELPIPLGDEVLLSSLWSASSASSSYCSTVDRGVLRIGLI